MKKKLLAMAVVLAIFCQAGEVLINPRSQTDFGAAAEIEVSPDGVMRPTGANCVHTVQHSVVDPAKTYRVTVEYKRAPGAPQNARGVVVVVPFNKRARQIEGVHVSFVAGSEAAVLEHSPLRGKRVVLELNDAWARELEKGARRTYAAVYKAEKDLSDIPNFAWSVIRAQRVEEERLVLDVDWTPSLVKGDLVRLHYYGWLGIGRDVIPEDGWQTLSYEITGVSKSACGDKFWAGTSAVGLGLYGKDVLYRNFTFEELE